VEGQSVLAPGSLLPPGRLIPRGQLWAGCPAQYVRDLSADEVKRPALIELTAVTPKRMCKASGRRQSQKQQQQQQLLQQHGQLQWPQL
jgi:carbonic anhydrase/acetyltransferase-like protein (isoleucine patch superfamily)